MDKIVTIDFEGINLNATHWSQRTEKEFTDSSIAEGKWADYPQADRLALIAEAYKQMKEKVAKTTAETPKVDVVAKAVAEMKVHGAEDVKVVAAPEAAGKSEKSSAGPGSSVSK